MCMKSGVCLDFDRVYRLNDILIPWLLLICVLDPLIAVTDGSTGHIAVTTPWEAATLLPVIQQHVANGSIVWSDEWTAYGRVASLPNVSSRGVVNHYLKLHHWGSYNVESYCNRVKIKLNRMHGCHKHQLANYLWGVLWSDSQSTPDQHHAWYSCTVSSLVHDRCWVAIHPGYASLTVLMVTLVSFSFSIPY